MKEAEEKKQNQEKEIDLLEVSGNIASSIKNGVVNFFSFLWKSLILIIKKSILLYRLTIRSWKLITLGIIVFAGVSYFLYINSEAFFISEGQALSRISNSPDIIQIVNSISIPNDESNVALNNDLNLKPEIYNKIISVNASWLIDLDGDGLADLVDYDNNYEINPKKDSLAVRMKDRFNISLKLKDQTIADDVQHAILQYLSKHPYVKNINDRRIENYKERASIYKEQASVLDSLQKYEYFIESQIKNNNVQSLKFGEFELIGSDEQKEKRLYHEDIITLKDEVIQSNASITYEQDPIVFIGTNTNLHASNSLIFYAKKVFMFWLPIFFIVFLIVKQKEFEEIFKINEFLEK